MCFLFWARKFVEKKTAGYLFVVPKRKANTNERRMGLLLVVLCLLSATALGWHDEFVYMQVHEVRTRLQVSEKSDCVCVCA